MDNSACIQILYSYDVNFLTNIHCWPFVTIGPQQLGYTPSTQWYYRGGTAITLGTNDGVKLSNVFIFGYEVGYSLSGCNGAALVNCHADALAGGGSGINSNAFQFIGGTQNTLVSNCNAWSNYNIGFYVSGTGSQVFFSNCNVGISKLYAYACDGGTMGVIGGSVTGAGTGIFQTGSGVVKAFGVAVATAVTTPTAGTVTLMNATTYTL